jgi:UPF0271 protein
MTPTSSSSPGPSVSLTTDIGEGFSIWKLGPDEELLGIVTAANIACGFHGGDPSIMRTTCEIAVANNVAIGAQVSYRDIPGFGRRFIEVPTDVLTDDLLYQMGALQAFAVAGGGEVGYIRAHGALYNAAAKHPGHAKAIVQATLDFDSSLPVLCQEGTETWNQAQAAGLRVVAEAFVDRAYTPEGLLLPRTEPNAIFNDPQAAAERAVSMVIDKKIVAVDGTTIPIRAESLLVHSDTAGATEIATATRDALIGAGVELLRSL